MSAHDITRAPSGAPTVDDALADASKWLIENCPPVQFLTRLAGMAAPCENMTEADGFALDAAGQHGFEHINDDATLYAVSERDLAAFVLNVRSCAVDHAEKLAHDRHQAVQVLNMSDAMRINFRAPDGRRATLRLDVLLDSMDHGGSVTFEPGISDTMRAAIAAYPVAGDPLPEACTDQACRPCATGDGPCLTGLTVTEVAQHHIVGGALTNSRASRPAKPCECVYDMGVSRLDRCPACGGCK